MHPAIDLHSFLGFAAALGLLVGAAMGSFITLITCRLPRGEPIGMTRSRCTSCSATLRARDLIPVISWLVGRGTCRYCKAAISHRYPLTELATGAGTAAIIAWQGELSMLTIALIGFLWVAIAMIVTDLEQYLLLDECQIALVLFGLLYGWATHQDATSTLLAVLVGGLGSAGIKYLFLLVTRRDGLGWGDVKLFAVAGFWLGHPLGFIPLLVFSGLLGIVMSLVWRAFGGGAFFPFGPAILVALAALIFYPPATAAFWQLYSENLNLLLPR
jgi:prepilin signal peptidase PulO-like enzyme (type II secretory pathway)